MAQTVRLEYEYPIPESDAREIIARLCGDHVVHKTRYRIPYHGKTWDVDEFHGSNVGLVVAEIELDDPDEPFDKPVWVGREVSEDPRYTNAQLSINPFTTWKSDG